MPLDQLKLLDKASLMCVYACAIDGIHSVLGHSFGINWNILCLEQFFLKTVTNKYVFFVIVCVCVFVCVRISSSLGY